MTVNELLVLNTQTRIQCYIGLRITKDPAFFIEWFTDKNNGQFFAEIPDNYEKLLELVGHDVLQSSFMVVARQYGGTKKFLEFLPEYRTFFNLLKTNK